MQSPHPLRDHIETIAKHEREFLARRTPTERLGDSIGAFVGSLYFVALHVCFFVSWALVNTLHIGSIPHFDPFPFSLLGTCVGSEAIVIASFILMRQARIGRRADERDHLILQILLLAEQEITAVLTLDRQIAEKVGLLRVATDTEIEQLSQHTSIDEIAQTIQDTLPGGQ
jgi:uncharacterized membrane protein